MQWGSQQGQDNLKQSESTYAVNQSPEPTAARAGDCSRSRRLADVTVKITWGGQVREESLHLSPNEYQQEQN
jgi:hypothetical protein